VNRPLLKPLRVWDDIIKIGSNCPQDRDQWRALVSNVVNPGSIKDGEFLVRVSASFSRRIVFCRVSCSTRLSCFQGGLCSVE
jgi:hypothetical protein